MTTGARKYPRATVRKLIKGHSNKKVARDVDALVYLDYVLFMQRLMENATRKAKESGEKKIAAKDIRKVTLVRERMLGAESIADEHDRQHSDSFEDEFDREKHAEAETPLILLPANPISYNEVSEPVDTATLAARSKPTAPICSTKQGA